MVRVDKKIKICFIQNNIYPLFKYQENTSFVGGSELQLYLIAKALSKNKDFQTSFVIGDFGQKIIEDYGNIKLYKSFNPKPDDNLLKKLIQAIKYYKLFKKINADIYFTSAVSSMVGLVSFFCQRNNRKHIYRTASLIDCNKEFIKKNGLIGRVYKYGLEHADLVLAQTNKNKELLKQKHNINAVILKNSFNIINNTKNIPKNYILWVSNCKQLKRPGLFLDLSKKFFREKFVMICPPVKERDEYWEKIKNEAENITNLEFIKQVAFNKIQKYFDKAKIFINTSIYEGFPNTFLQAGIAKTPILSLSVDPDFLEEYNCGYCAEDNFNKLVKYLNILLNNKKEWKEKSNNIYKYVTENHNIKNNVNQLIKLIYQLLNNENSIHSTKISYKLIL